MMTLILIALPIFAILVAAYGISRLDRKIDQAELEATRRHLATRYDPEGWRA